MPDLDPEKIAKKKVLGVPAMYLLGGGAAVLALYAWKSSSNKDTADTSSEAAPDAATDAYAGSDVLPVMSTGTVVVAPVESTPTASNPAIETNDDWIKAGVLFLSKSGTSAGTAQVALQAYLSGAQLSFVQGGYRDRVIREFGLPPYLQSVGGTDPAKKPVKPPVNTPKPAPPNDTAIMLAIKRAYRLSLGREASAAEVAYWVKSGTKGGDIANKIGASSEARRAAIAQYYRLYLKRDASKSEVTHWANSHLSLPSVEAQISQSHEAQTKRRK